jgi:hypothetical protein
MLFFVVQVVVVHSLSLSQFENVANVANVAQHFFSPLFGEIKIIP